MKKNPELADEILMPKKTLILPKDISCPAQAFKNLAQEKDDLLLELIRWADLWDMALPLKGADKALRSRFFSLMSEDQVREVSENHTIINLRVLYKHQQLILDFMNLIKSEHMCSNTSI